MTVYEVPTDDMNVLMTIIENLTDPEVTFNLMVELIIPFATSRFDSDRNAGNVDVTTESMEFWFTEPLMEEVATHLHKFPTEVHVRVLEGQIENRGLECLTGESDDLSLRLFQDAQIALRNEVAYRLTDRGAIPGDHGWTERFDPGN